MRRGMSDVKRNAEKEAWQEKRNNGACGGFAACLPAPKKNRMRRGMSDVTRNAEKEVKQEKRNNAAGGGWFANGFFRKVFGS